MEDSQMHIDSSNLEKLANIEKSIGKKIPQLYNIRWNSFGLLVEDGKITSLALSNIKINSLPNMIFQLPLRMLSLINLGLDSIPDLFSNFQNLQELYIGGNALSIIPPSFSYLKSLKFLYILEDNLKFFPNIDLSFNKLEEVSLSSNVISEFPEHFKSVFPSNCRVFFNNNQI
jgi:Leucine-rich repeat (LRR) protein